MAIRVEVAAVAAEAVGEGVSRRRLLDTERVPRTRILLDRIEIAPGAALALEVAEGSLAWFQILAGTAEFSGSGVGGAAALGADHVVFLPPGFRGRLASAAGAALIMAEAPEADALDSDFAARPPALRILDWTREPVLDSEHDARKRIYLATPRLFGTHAIKGEMIIYPPGTSGANHHHVGADHFMYFLKGSGTAYADERPFRVKAGDLVYYPDLERHYLAADPDCEMAFVEFFAPGSYRTVWVNPETVCTWNPTGRDIRGNAGVRAIARHGGEAATPSDV
ncbi:cupin domain-containing protein [Propylenella binzhouense]|uniref:Cupin domain-containing protein n=1 Tax=Propylenella binzhouense TaxID=2555902 RepID=A0A964T5A8_9HYPH|nr:cupin domain-containing protein [Propylenella binzhouense]MYZ48733.1 cupin domain-containing protein [Propylenella binzhouense]